MDRQTAVRRGNWKLVLRGQLVEHVLPEDDVHLSDQSVDPGERQNLATAHPEIAADLERAAQEWRDGIERRWTAEWLPRMKGVTAHT